MRLRSAPVSGLKGPMLCVTILTALCAAFPGFADDHQKGVDADAEPVQNAGWKKKIKRLKLADPESSETMLASTNLVVTDRGARVS